MKKFLIILLTMFIGVGIFSCSEYVTYADYDYTKILERADKNWTGDSVVTNKTRTIAASIINLIQVVGTGVAIVMLTYIGIKYMMAAPNEKADFKKSVTGFIVGAVVLFASTNIIAIISNFATSNIK